MFVACRSVTLLPHGNHGGNLQTSRQLICSYRLHMTNIGTNERSPIILGRPYLNTAGAIIYASTAKIAFNIKGNREAFSFKNRTLSFPAQKETIGGRNKSNT